MYSVISGFGIFTNPEFWLVTLEGFVRWNPSSHPWPWMWGSPARSCLIIKAFRSSTTGALGELHQNCMLHVMRLKLYSSSDFEQNLNIWIRPTIGAQAL